VEELNIVNPALKNSLEMRFLYSNSNLEFPYWFRGSRIGKKIAYNREPFSPTTKAKILGDMYGYFAASQALSTPLLM
jgi:hypothetical protein